MGAAARSFGVWLLKVAVALGLLAGAGAGGFQAWTWARTSPTFAVQTLEVEGAQRVPAAELLRLGRLVKGVNLFSFDARAAEREMASHPWVRLVSLTRRLPSGVHVRVEERTAVALVSLGELYLVDTDGELFKRVQASDGVDAPLVTGLDRAAFGQRPEAEKARLVQALDAIAAWGRDEALAHEPLSEVRLSDDGLALVTMKGLEVRLGDGGLQKGLERLAKVKRELAARRLEAALVRLDNRVRPDWVTVQLLPGVLERGSPAGK